VRTAAVGLLLAGLPLLFGGGAEASTVSDAATTQAAVITRWVDGDTVETTLGTVRLIGIDTPEVGSCGFAASSRHAAAVAPVGSRVLLGDPASVIDHDRYGRILRYVDTASGRDVGRAQIRAGARARYDGRDGYQWHPRQSAYRRLDARSPGYRCAATTTSPGRGTAPIGDGECPPSAPIKGNADSMIYHRPGQRYYDITKAEVCFATAAQAEAAGYRAAQV
jgi:endonuclease YncB( thermonuclease family)